jgi:hypothetical protein
MVHGTLRLLGRQGRLSTLPGLLRGYANGALFLGEVSLAFRQYLRRRNRPGSPQFPDRDRRWLWLGMQVIALVAVIGWPGGTLGIAPRLLTRLWSAGILFLAFSLTLHRVIELELDSPE